MKVVWPPLLGWTPVVILLLRNWHNPYGAHGVMAEILLAVLSTFVLVPWCLWNLVRIGEWRDMRVRLRLSLAFLNLSLPLGVVALMIFAI